MTASDALTGEALAREVERVCFNDDGSCFDADGNERRERLGKVVNDALVCAPTVLYHAMLDNNPCGHPINNWQFREVALWAWDNRHSEPWCDYLVSKVASCCVPPRPFDRDPVLAMGLLGDYFSVDRSNRHAHVVSYFATGQRAAGSADYSEFPDAKDDDERRVLAFCHAVLRAVLASRAVTATPLTSSGE